MERFDRFYALHGLLSTHKHPVALTRIMEELECAKSSATRLIGKMRLYLDATIKYDRQQNGYYYDQSKHGDHPYELPGLWFNTSELHALLTSHTLLEHVDPGIYSQQINPLRDRIKTLLEKTGQSSDEISRRIRIPGLNF